MASKRNLSKKDGWGKFAILSQALLGIAVAVFSGVFGVLGHQNARAKLELARSNFKIARANLQVALIPSLSSENPQKRAMALPLARDLDEEFATVISATAIVHNSSEIVQRNAKLNLEKLSKSRHIQVKNGANNALNKHALMMEVAVLGLQEKMETARNYIEGGSPDGKEKAVNIYLSILEQLPFATLRKLDQDMLRLAQEDEQNGYWDSAARKFMVLFPLPTY